VGKLGKETVDRIRALLGEGYNKAEVANKLGITRKTVGKYAVDTESSLVREASGKMSLSLDSDITTVLYDMQGVMGAPSLVGAVKQAYRDEVSVAKLKVTHWPTYAVVVVLGLVHWKLRLVGFDQRFINGLAYLFLNISMVSFVASCHVSSSFDMIL